MPNVVHIRMYQLDSITPAQLIQPVWEVGELSVCRPDCVPSASSATLFAYCGH